MPTLEDLLGSTAAWTPNVSAAPDAVPMPSLPSLPTLPGSQPTLESQPAPQMPQWAPAVNAPEPQVRPQPRPAQPGNRAEQIRQIASLLMPLIVGTIATSKGGALAGAAAMSGANQANALAMNQRRQDALWAQQEQDRQAQIGARLAEVETQRQRNRSAFVTDAFAAVNAITDPVEHQQTVEQLDQAGAEQWGLRPGWLKRSAVFSDSRRATAIKKEADALLSKLEAGESLGEALKDPKGWGMKIQFPSLGRELTLRELAQYAGRPDRGDGTYLLAGKGGGKADTPNTPEESYIADAVAAENERRQKAGQPPMSRQESADLRLSLRGKWGRSDDDPMLRAVRAMTLSQQRANGGQLSPRSQNRVDSITRSFEGNQVVKRTQTIAESVDFINSLDINSKNPADDQALIYAFAKAMDPDSVVREGEYQTVQKYSQAWVEMFGFNALRVLSNREFLTPQARQNMKNTIFKKFQAAQRQYDVVRKAWGQRINRITGRSDGEDYLTDYSQAFPQDSRPGSAGGTVRVLKIEPVGK